MKKNLIKITSVLMVFVIVFSALSIAPYALNFIGSGSGSSGGGSVSASGGYSLYSTDSCQGYRFSYIDSNGNKLGVIDVIKSSEQSNYNGRTRFSRKLNKKEFVTLYNNKVNFDVSTETAQVGRNATWIDSALSFYSSLNYSFSGMASKMEVWQGWDKNINTVLSKMSSSYSISKMQPGDMVLIEPIIFCNFNNTNYAVTLTELWMMAGSMFGYSTAAKYGGNNGTFNRIAYRTNGTFPNSLYTTNGKGLWTNATGLSVPSQANSQTGPTFTKLITYGFGVCIAFTNTNYVTYSHWLSGLPEGTGTNGYKNAVRLSYNSETYSGSITVTTNKIIPASKLPKGIYGSTYQFGSESFASSWTNYSYPRTFSGQSGAKYIQINYGATNYNITYNLNGGTLTKANPSTYTVLQGASFTNSPTKSGYTFIGWYIDGVRVTGVNEANLSSAVIINNTGTSDCSTKTLYNAINARRTGDVTVVAQWSKDAPDKVTATFNSNGGTTASPLTIVKTPGEALGTLPTTSRSEYTFEGWYTAQTGGSKISSSTTMPNKNVVYYAHWTKNPATTYSVKYNGNGDSSVKNIPASQTKTKGVDLTLSSQKPTRTGYYFDSWYNSATALLGTRYESGSKYTKDANLNLYAHWIPYNLTICYDCYGSNPTINTSKGYKFDGTYNRICTTTYTNKEIAGTKNVYYHTLEYGKTIGIGGLKDFADFGLTAPTGYKFTGWKSGDNGKIFNETSTLYKATDFTDDITNGDTYVWLTAQFELNQYTATFDANGGATASPQTITKTYGSALGTLPTTSRSGYTFEGWYTDKTGGTKISSSTTMPARNVTYYAHWKENKPVLQLQPIAANSAYREKTDVITSFYLINTSSVDCIPGYNISVKFTVQKSNGTVIKMVTKTQVIAPKNDYNLLYFKWTVPTGLSSQSVKISGEIIDSGKSYGNVSANYSTTPNVTSVTPDTQFEKKAPAGFSIKTPPSTISQTANWSEWTYSSNKFTKINYGIGIANNSASIMPATGSTAKKQGSTWYMKSGYGVSLSVDNGIRSVSGYTSPTSTAYTLPQYATALFPEFYYSTAQGKYKTLLLTSGNWSFMQNGSYGKTHFTPLWYPNGNYTVSITQSDMWTPAGMIKRTSNTNTIKITDSAYDDWYVGR